jgi:16S rRNA C1402 (ribose-2'-O) methylase RsmI
MKLCDAVCCEHQRHPAQLLHFYAGSAAISTVKLSVYCSCHLMPRTDSLAIAIADMKHNLWTFATRN